MSVKFVPFKPVSCKCRYECGKLKDEVGRKLHREFWKETSENQGNFLFGLIHRMVLMTLIWVVAMNYFEKVDLKFLVSGHSYMPCDRDFGIIEKRKKVCKTMVPGEVADMIRDAKSTQPFQVVSMGPADFKDIVRCSDTFLNTEGLKISTVSWIQISRAEFPTIKTRGTLNELEQWKQVKILKKGQSIQNIVEMGPFPELQSRPTIADAKKKDLLAMLDFMDSKYRSC